MHYRSSRTHPSPAPPKVITTGSSTDSFSGNGCSPFSSPIPFTVFRSASFLAPYGRAASSWSLMLTASREIADLLFGGPTYGPLSTIYVEGTIT